MKSLKLFATVLLLSFVLVSCDDDDDKTIPFDQLPAAPKEFLQTHFPQATPLYVEKDKDGYDVYLSNGIKIDFYLNGDWESIDGKSKTGFVAIPESILLLEPLNIINTYVKAGYPTNFIVEIDKEYFLQHKVNGYEITLDTDLELLFNDQGVFLGIDH